MFEPVTETDVKAADPLVLRVLMDCILISLFKHDAGPPTSGMAHLAFSAISSCIDVLTISGLLHEGRITALASFTTFLKRRPNMAINLLGRQVVACLDCMAEDLSASNCQDFLNMAFDAHSKTIGVWLLFFRSLAASSSNQTSKRLLELKTFLEQRSDRSSLELAAVEDLQAVFSIQKPEMVAAILDGFGLFVCKACTVPFNEQWTACTSTWKPRRELDVACSFRRLPCQVAQVAVGLESASPSIEHGCLSRKHSACRAACFRTWRGGRP
jgi:hypothetical protein